MQTDDIVTRLRIENYPLLKFGNHQDWCTALVIMDEAADEIERLQQLVEHLSSQLRLQMKANDKAWEAYKEVVGDD